MFDQLMNLVKQYSGDAIVNNPAIPNEQNEEAMSATSGSIMDTLKGMMSGGGAGNVLNLFNQHNSSDVQNHPVTQTATSNVISTLMNKFGLDNNKAGGIASSIVPMIMSKLVSKTNDSNDSSFSLQGIMNSLSGNKTSGMDIGGIASHFGGSGLDQNHDGKVNLSDLTAAFSGNTSNNNQEESNNSENNNNEGGGIMDSIKGLFGK